MRAPAQRALLSCARVDLDEAARQELRALVRDGLDLGGLVREARRHGLSALVSRHLADVAPEGAPGAWRAELRADAQRAAVASLAAAADLGTLLGGLRSAGVTALAIKGPVSAALCYGDLGLRAFSDLDLLVAPEEAAAAAAHLEARGYVPRFALSPAWRARLVRSDS